MRPVLANECFHGSGPVRDQGRLQADFYPLGFRVGSFPPLSVLNARLNLWKTSSFSIQSVNPRPLASEEDK
jgi:hypothetical protein